MRRTLNRLFFPAKDMLWSPQEGAYVYFPFHMAPESMLDTWAPFYQNQLAFVVQVAQAIPIDMSFVVKLHFSDPDNYSRRQLKELMSLPRMHIAHPSASGSIFLEKASLVIGITGTSCLEAALIGKPVIVFGDSPYVNFPRSERAERPDKLYGQIRRMLDQSPPTDNEIAEAYAAYMARYMPGRINDWSRRFTEDELQRLTDCFMALASYVSEPANRQNWYKSAHFSA
jgi:capsule polysaccharide modification protein KpsS